MSITGIVLFVSCLHRQVFGWSFSSLNSPRTHSYLTSTRKHGHTVSHVAKNFISSVSHRPTLKPNFGYLDLFNAVYTKQILPKYRTTSFFIFLALKMTRTKTTKSLRAAAKWLGTKKSVVVAKNKSNEAARMIASKVVKDIMEKKRKAQKTEPPSKHPYSKKLAAAIATSAHRDGNFNEWDPENVRFAYEQYEAQKMDDWHQNQPKLSRRFRLNCSLLQNFKYMITQMSKNAN